MWRDIDPRDDERERPDLSRGERRRDPTTPRRRADDPRDVFTRDLDLPRGSTREPVRRPRPIDRSARVRGPDAGDGRAPSASCRVATFGTTADARADASNGELERLREAGLVRDAPLRRRPRPRRPS